MKKDELKKHIDRAGAILAKVVRLHRDSLPSIKAEAEAMKKELGKVGELEKVFRKRSQEVLEALKKRKRH